jgi:hypothetical protein
VKLTFTEFTLTSVTETFPGVFGVVADAGDAATVSAAAASMTTLADSANVVLNVWLMVLLETLRFAVNVRHDHPTAFP